MLLLKLAWFDQVESFKVLSGSCGSTGSWVGTPLIVNVFNTWNGGWLISSVKAAPYGQRINAIGSPQVSMNTLKDLPYRSTLPIACGPTCSFGLNAPIPRRSWVSAMYSSAADS